MTDEQKKSKRDEATSEKSNWFPILTLRLLFDVVVFGLKFIYFPNFGGAVWYGNGSVFRVTRTPKIYLFLSSVFANGCLLYQQHHQQQLFCISQHKRHKVHNSSTKRRHQYRSAHFTDCTHSHMCRTSNEIY